MCQENSSSSLQQLITRNKFIKWGWQYYSRGRRNVQEKPHGRFTRSIQIDWLIDKPETRRPKGTQFSGKKKILHKRKNGFNMSTQNITSLDGSSYEAIHSSISQNIFSYLKMFSMQCRKIITDEDNKKGINKTNFINIYTYIYISILFVAKMTQNKNYWINSCYWQ